MNNVQKALRSHPFMDGLSNHTVNKISACAEECVFESGTYVFRTGDSADHFYLITDGTVALEAYVPGPGPFRFLTLKQGELLGASWLVRPYRWVYDAHAVKLTRAIAFDSLCMRSLFDSDHHIGYQMITRLLPPLLERLQMARLQSVDLYGKGPSNA